MLQIRSSAAHTAPAEPRLAPPQLTAGLGVRALVQIQPKETCWRTLPSFGNRNFNLASAQTVRDSAAEPWRFRAVPLGCGAEDTAAVEPGERLVTVLVTLSVPDTADADDAATLIAVAADTALQVVHTAGVEGHLPVPGTTVLRGRQPRPWMVQSVTAETAILTDLAGGVIQVTLTSLHPDEVASPRGNTTDPTPTPPHPTGAGDHRSDPT